MNQKFTKIKIYQNLLKNQQHLDLAVRAKHSRDVLLFKPEGFLRGKRSHAAG